MSNLPIKKVEELSKVVGIEHVATVLSKVPIKNVYCALRCIPIPTLAKIFQEVSIRQLISGLKIITPFQIENVPIDKLRIVLVEGDMKTIEKLQKTFPEKIIAKALIEMDERTISSLIAENNFQAIEQSIKMTTGIIDG